MTQSARRTAMLVAIAMCAACDSTSTDGFYGLSAVDGHPLPALVGATVNCDETLSSGQLQILSDQYDLSLAVFQDCRRAGGDTSTQLVIGTGGVRDSSGSLVFTDSVGGGELVGRQVGGDIDLDYSDLAFVLAPHTLRFVHTTPIRRGLITAP